MEGKLFGDVPIDLEMRLSVEDSLNSAGVTIDAIRCAKVALKRGQGGVCYGLEGLPIAESAFKRAQCDLSADVKGRCRSMHVDEADGVSILKEYVISPN